MCLVNTPFWALGWEVLAFVAGDGGIGYGVGRAGVITGYA